MKVDTSRLQYKLMLLILLMVVPWLAASVQNGFSQRKVLMKQVEAQGLELMGYIDSTERTGLRRILEAAEMVLLEGGEEFDIGAQQRALDRLSARSKRPLDVAITDFSGKVFVSSFSDIDPSSIMELDCLCTSLRTGQISFEPFTLPSSDNKRGVVVAYPVISPDNRNTTAIVAFLYEESLLAPIRHLDLPKDIAFELADCNWNTVTSYHASDRAVGLTESSDIGDIRQLLAFSVDGELSTFREWEDGSKYLVSVKTVTDYQGRPVLYAAATVPAGADVTRVTLLAFYQVAVMLGIALIIIPVTWGLMTEQFVEPVNKLVLLTERLGRGEMDVRHGEPYQSGEVGELAMAFDEMADALEERTQEMEYLSYHDRLTGTYNRAYIESIGDELDQEGNIPTTIILGDINGLKMVNDTYGHQAGNELIATIGSIMQDCVGEHGIVARWGGDEFIAVLPNTSMKNGLHLCSKIRSACQSAGNYPVQPSIALGVASRMAVEQTIMDTLITAESRMYRNKFIDTSSARGTLLHSLRKALAESTHETEEHSSRMRFLALELGQMMGLSSSTLDDLAILASLHDIGKIGIPDSILQKPGPLTDEEWYIMKAHTEIGARIVGGSYELSHISEAILSHHERWNGTGYPSKLKEDDIPLISRILAIVDSYDAMTSDRAYRKAMSRKEALAEIERCSGSQFDPDLVEIFLVMMEEIEKSEEDEMDWLAAGMQWYEDLSEENSDDLWMPDDEE